jgi:hypothetical protein
MPSSEEIQWEHTKQEKMYKDLSQLKSEVGEWPKPNYPCFWEGLHVRSYSRHSSKLIFCQLWRKWVEISLALLDWRKGLRRRDRDMAWPVTMSRVDPHSGGLEARQTQEQGNSNMSPTWSTFTNR